MKKIKKSIKRALGRIFLLLPNRFKSFLIPYLRKSTRLNNLVNSLSLTGKFAIKVPPESRFYIQSKGGLIENDIILNGLFNSWEKDTGWLWMELARVSSCAFDIGANVGIYSLVYKSINPNGKIYAFEPSIHHFPTLVRNNKINTYDIECRRMALSNFSGEQVFYDLPHANANTASLSPDKMKNWSGYKGEINEYAVETYTLSDFIVLEEIAEIDLMKIDVELHEPEVIEGLGTFLLKYKPIIFIEVLTEEVSKKLDSLIDLQQHQLFHLAKSGRVLKVESFGIDKNDNSKWEWNFLLFHNSLEDKLRAQTSLFEKI